MIDKIIGTIQQSQYFQEKVAGLEKNHKITFAGLPGSSPAAVIAALAGGRPLLVVAPSTGTGQAIKAEVELLINKKAAFFPALDTLPGEETEPSKELVGQRLGLLADWPQLTIVPVKALLPMTSKTIKTKRLKVGDSADRDELIAWLVEQGYQRFEIVGERGELAVRGGIVDIYPVNLDHALRMELSDDKILGLRAFNAYDQRSIGPLETALIVPAKEKREVPIFDHFPAGLVIALIEPLELSRSVEAGWPDLSRQIDGFPRVELSSFAVPEDEAVFCSPENYFNKLSELPPGCLIISKHAARLREEVDREIITGSLRGGFIFSDVTVLTDRELFGEEYVQRKVKPANEEGVADELLADLKRGDFVVHENYGIGLYRGQQTLAWEGVKQEYLLLEFADGDKVYVPPSMAGLVEKYAGVGDYQPRLSHLGTATWQKTKGRVKKALKDMTKELIALYAARNKLPGYTFPTDDIWQKELEGTFPYEETPDQLKAINEVKRDMELGKPMDRLVCGDVGYGKTEVAIRAAAKAAAAGKQVAVLVPTTILAEQHYNNFKARFASTPFVVEMLSRFKSAQEQKQIIKALAGGGVDIVVGTHRLLSKDIAFKDIGLMIIDEEHRFGVAHKEKLKRLKQTVDVITLTATPIPRTLYLSLSGARDMSLINTPPVDRSPIHTYVLPWNETVVKEAVLRELDRGGQVYFVHNRVESIIGLASKIRKLLPSARIAIGHGQLPEKELERTMLAFADRKFDILVCTSIIESGLDIPNVNTILIDDADQLGLAQLYQIRGRVGRSAARAYAYLFYRPGRVMTDQALERLKAIQELTALGSGYKLAMKDLEIRGAGNMLGAEQSGHIYEVGFDLYCELLEAAVKEVKGIKDISPREVVIDLKEEAFIPSDYIEDDRQRLATYRRLNLLGKNSEVEEIKRELVDRFGKLPRQLERLFAIINLRIKALQSGIQSISENEGIIQIDWLAGKRKKLAITGEDKIRIALRGIGQ